MEINDITGEIVRAPCGFIRLLDPVFWKALIGCAFDMNSKTLVFRFNRNSPFPWFIAM
jgi:hypothetical protein